MIMRQVLHRYAKSAACRKRGGDMLRAPIPVDNVENYRNLDPEALLSLESAMDQLKILDARKYRLVELRFLLGLSVEEVAEILGLSTRTVRREWRFSKTWLKRRLQTNESGPS
jgi:RNA polymerase sigma factor (sigma-70 family)